MRNINFSFKEQRKLFKTVPDFKVGAMAAVVSLFMLSIFAIIGLNGEITKEDWKFTSTFVGLNSLFLVFGIYCLFSAWANMRIMLTLLRSGTVTKGRILKIAATGTRIGNHSVYKVIFEYIKPNGELVQTVQKTFVPRKIKVKEPQMVLFDETNSSKAILFDLVPSFIKEKLKFTQ